MTDQPTTRPDNVPTPSDVDGFLATIAKAKPTKHGRLIFALDATGSRQPSWDQACELQSEMFREVQGLEVQLVYYRGEGECQASRWTSDPSGLTRTMRRIMCEAGETQIDKVLQHVVRETKLLPVSALVFVGDACEENPDTLVARASGLGVPAFMFQEGQNEVVATVFKGIAHASHGAYCRFSPGAAKELGELLKVVASYATGGLAALEGRKDAAAVKLLEQLK
jgi:hypothetical protein